MIDNEQAHDVQTGEQAAVLYDWFKYLTSLSLLTLGGVLSLSQSDAVTDIKKAMLVLVLVLLSLAGMASFSGAAMVVDSSTKATPLSRWIKVTGTIAAMSLSMGIGAFLFIFVKVI
jgi:hypothetical protein